VCSLGFAPCEDATCKFAGGCDIGMVLNPLVLKTLDSVILQENYVVI